MRAIIASETPFEWRRPNIGRFVIFYVIRTSIAEKPYIFVLFRGGGGGGSGPPAHHPPLDPGRYIFCNGPDLVSLLCNYASTISITSS